MRHTNTVVRGKSYSSLVAVVIAFLLGFAVDAVWFQRAGQVASAQTGPTDQASQVALLNHTVNPGIIKPGRWTNKVWVWKPAQASRTVLPESQWPESTKTEVAKFRAGQKKWPPMFPNPYAIKIFENDKIIVYDTTLGEVDRLHRHVRDLFAFYLQDDGEGRGISIVDGKAVVTTTKEDQDTMNGDRGASTQRYDGAPLPHMGGYVKAGLLHSEAIVDPKKGTVRRIFIELKGTEAPDCKEWSTAC